MKSLESRLQEFGVAADFPELREGRLLALVERWLRAEKADRVKRRAAQQGEGADGQVLQQPEWNNGWAPGRLASSFKHASNTVMRM